MFYSLSNCCFRLFVLLSLVSLNPVLAACKGAISSSEYDALRSLYGSTGGNEWQWRSTEVVDTRWSFPSNLAVPCSIPWHGITCQTATSGSSAHCQILSLALPYLNLTGSLPTEIGVFSSLTTLRLNDNQLTGNVAELYVYANVCVV